MEQFTLEQVLTGTVGFCTLIGGAVIFLRKQGLISFHRKPDFQRMPSVCPEHAKLSSDIAELKTSAHDQGEVMQEVKGSVDRMLGYLEGRNGAKL